MALLTSASVAACRLGSRRSGVTASARSSSVSVSAMRPPHRGHQRQYEQRPAHGPVVARLRRHRERSRRRPRPAFSGSPKLLVRTRGEHEQPGAVPGGDPGRSQRPVQRSDGLRDRPALIRHWASVQCRSPTRSGSTACASAWLGDLLGPGCIAETVEGISEPDRQTVMLGRAGPGSPRPRAGGVPPPPGAPG